MCKSCMSRSFDAAASSRAESVAWQSAECRALAQRGARAFEMPRDLLEGIFEAPQGASPEPSYRDPAADPFFEQRPGGRVLPHRVDNDRQIEFYEDALRDLVETFGPGHAGVPYIASGLAVLYDTKAGIEKQSAHYDKALEAPETTTTTSTSTLM